MKTRLGMTLLVIAMLLTGVAQAQSQTVTLSAYLTGGSENPPLPVSAVGVANITVDVATGSVTVEGRLYNLSSSITGFHFHSGTPGVNGPVILNLGLPAASNDLGFSVTVNASTFTARGEQGIGSPEDVLQAILSGTTYVNVHTQLNGGGEARGQVCLNPGQTNPMTGIIGCVLAAQ